MQPYSSTAYAWDQPSGAIGKQQVTVEVEGSVDGPRDYSLDQLGPLDVITVSALAPADGTVTTR